MKKTTETLNSFKRVIFFISLSLTLLIDVQAVQGNPPTEAELIQYSKNAVGVNTTFGKKNPIDLAFNFDRQDVEEKISILKSFGINFVRVFLSYPTYINNPTKYKKDLHFLMFHLAKSGISICAVLFDSIGNLTTDSNNDNLFTDEDLSNDAVREKWFRYPNVPSNLEINAYDFFYGPDQQHLNYIRDVIKSFESGIKRAKNLSIYNPDINVQNIPVLLEVWNEPNNIEHMAEVFSYIISYIKELSNYPVTIGVVDPRENDIYLSSFLSNGNSPEKMTVMSIHPYGATFFKSLLTHQVEKLTNIAINHSVNQAFIATEIGYAKFHQTYGVVIDALMDVQLGFALWQGFGPQGPFKEGSLFVNRAKSDKGEIYLRSPRALAILKAAKMANPSFDSSKVKFRIDPAYRLNVDEYFKDNLIGQGFYSARVSNNLFKNPESYGAEGMPKKLDQSSESFDFYYYLLAWTSVSLAKMHIDDPLVLQYFLLFVNTYQQGNLLLSESYLMSYLQTVKNILVQYNIELDTGNDPEFLFANLEIQNKSSKSEDKELTVRVLPFDFDLKEVMAWLADANGQYISPVILRREKDSPVYFLKTSLTHNLLNKILHVVAVDNEGNTAHTQLQLSENDFYSNEITQNSLGVRDI